MPPPVLSSRDCRRWRLPEYYHASVGTSRRSLDGPRLQAFFIHGHSTLSPQQWQGALDQVAAANPGTHLRMVGWSWWTRWKSDGAPPRLRIIDRCDWDMQSDRGSEFVNATPLDRGPTIELVVAGRSDGSTLLVLRSHHAVTDGIGRMHIAEELFRALRGEPLLGSNASFSDVDLVFGLGRGERPPPAVKVDWLTGAPAGDEIGDTWRRISLGPPGKNLLGRVAEALAQFARQHSQLPLLFGIPVNLRRHVPGLLSTTNFSSMLGVPLYPGEGAEQFTQRLKDMLSRRMETCYPRILNTLKLLPLRLIDRVLSRKLENYRTRKAPDTAVISNMGRYDAAALSCAGFRPERMFALPLSGGVFASLICIGEQVEMTLGMPRVIAGNGRFDALVEHLKKQLGA
jgi:hypothetical protein